MFLGLGHVLGNESDCENRGSPLWGAKLSFRTPCPLCHKLVQARGDEQSSPIILLQEESDQEETGSHFQQWLVIGTANCMDLRHYTVPKGKAAIVTVSATPSGITAMLALAKRLSNYLEFTMGQF